MKKIKILVLFVGLFSFSFLTLHIGLFSTYSKPLNRYIQSNDNTGNLKISATYTEIIINDLPGSLTNWTWAITQPWCTQGSGSSGDPYIIENAEFDSAGGNCLRIYHSRKDFIIRNCTFKNSGFTFAGLQLYNTSNGVITNNSDYNTSHMITLSNCSKNSITGNIASGNIQIGISLFFSSDNTVNGNTVCNNNYCGIYLDGTNENNDISGNIVYNNSGDGIYVDSGDFNTISGNIVYKNSRNGINCIVSNHTTISGNTVHNNSQYGIYIYESNFNDLSGNIVYNHTFTGIYCKDTNNTIISNNEIFNNYLGIYLEEGFYNEILDNDIHDNPDYYGIDLEDSPHNNIEGNEIRRCFGGIEIDDLYSGPGDANENMVVDNIIEDNEKNGIWLQGNFTTISGNTLRNNSLRGVYLYEFSYYNIITNNVLNDNFIGLELLNSSNNQILTNEISDSEFAGAGPSPDSDNNLFSENFFLRNKKHAYDFGANNDWNSLTIGNYWDNYTGTDANYDGIGDTPHDITGPSGSKDYLPIWDDGVPLISITSPLNNTNIGRDAPDFSVEITEPNLDTIWYTIDGGINNITCTSNGTIDQTSWETLWDSLAKGDNITIMFYANDTYGHLGYNFIVLIKHVPKDKIGLDYLTTSVLIFLISGVAIIGIITRMYHKKRIIT